LREASRRTRRKIHNSFDSREHELNAATCKVNGEYVLFSSYPTRGVVIVVIAILILISVQKALEFIFRPRMPNRNCVVRLVSAFEPVSDLSSRKLCCSTSIRGLPKNEVEPEQASRRCRFHSSEKGGSRNRRLLGQEMLAQRERWR
jgi:hypothetical protein